MKKYQLLALALEEHVESLMDELDLPIEEYTVSLRDIRGCAPCHDGDNPTGWIYYVDKGKWFCWTEGCHKEYGSDLIGLVRVVKNCSFKEAVLWSNNFLSNKNGVTAKELEEKKKSRVSIKRDFWQEHTDQKIFHKSILKKLDTAVKYARFRRLSWAIMRKMGAGYARKGRLGGRVVLPVRNIDGNIVGFTGRKIHDNMNGPKWFHKFKTDINLFNIDRAAKFIKETGSSTIFVVEGPWDMIKMEMAGFPNTVACFGVYLSTGQTEILNKIGVNNIILGLDNDDAGNKNSIENKKRLEQNGFDVCIISPRKGFDFGDKGTSTEEIVNIVKKSCPEIQPVR